LEEAIVGKLEETPGVAVLVTPHLNDLAPDGAGVRALQAVAGDIVAFSWLYPRAAFWILDCQGIRGRQGRTMLASPSNRNDQDRIRQAHPVSGGRATDGRTRVNDVRPVPARQIDCLDLRAADAAQPFLDEVRSIVAGLSPVEAELAEPCGVGQATRIDEQTRKRWRPVIDYSRCTNCMECSDFCLFGVYGLDQAGTILVEQPDNCRNGCPACSRVCPDNAIIFPQHKTPAIAGSPMVSPIAKIDLSQLFGAPPALETAARERGRELVPNRRGEEPATAHPGGHSESDARPVRDELDELIESLDEFDP
jgi:NAD-dependent dihydropyrimidine dehydrogenase PreA subunit